MSRMFRIPSNLAKDVYDTARYLRQFYNVEDSSRILASMLGCYNKLSK